jgi:hypothetical protein
MRGRHDQVLDLIALLWDSGSQLGVDVSRPLACLSNRKAQ